MCKELNSKIKTKVIIADFTEKNNLQFYDELYAKMSDLDVSMLICNAGILRFGLYEEIEHKFLNDLLDVFVYNVAIMNKKFLKKMRERKQRSAVINVASCAGMQPLPRLSHYCAVKSFIASFTSAIAFENKDKIDYLALCPGAMSTNIMGPFLRDLAASADTMHVAEHSYKELVNPLKVVSYGTLLCNLYGYPLVLLWNIPVVCDMILYHFLALAKSACDHEINKVKLFKEIRDKQKKE
jgi:short-subunit dehydrogenase